MNIDLELFKKYFLNTHFNYKDEILYITNEIKNNKPIYIIIENIKRVYYYFCDNRWIEKIDNYSFFSNVNNCIHELIPPCINWGNGYGMLSDDKIIFKIFYKVIKKNIKFYPLIIKKNFKITNIEKNYLFNLILIFNRYIKLPKELFENIITFLRRIDILKNIYFY